MMQTKRSSAGGGCWSHAASTRLWARHARRVEAGELGKLREGDRVLDGVAAGVVVEVHENGVVWLPCIGDTPHPGPQHAVRIAGRRAPPALVETYEAPIRSSPVGLFSRGTVGQAQSGASTLQHLPRFGCEPAFVAQLNRSLNRALTNETVRQRFRELGLEPTPGSTDDAGKYIVESMALQESMRKLAFPKTP